MRRSIGLTTLAAAVALAAPLGPASSAAADGHDSAGQGGMFVPLNQGLRRCDYTVTAYNGPTGYARATSVVRTNGSDVSADVTMDTAIPNMRYDVRLIQAPRPSAATCHGGDPGVAAGVMQIDGVGHGALTLHDTVEPGASGVWVFITRPDAFSQNPAEFYTSDWLADI